MAVTGQETWALSQAKIKQRCKEPETLSAGCTCGHSAAGGGAQDKRGMETLFYHSIVCCLSLPTTTVTSLELGGRLLIVAFK